MRVDVLGPLRVVDDSGAPVRLGGTLERRLLAALAARAHEIVTLDLLVDAVFGSAAPDGGGLRVQHHISRLRRRIGADAVVTEGLGYRLDHRVLVDWHEMERAVACGPGGGLDASSALLLWRGDPLIELVEWEYVEGLRQRLAEWHDTLVDRLAATWIRTGRAADAVAELEASVAATPLREQRWMLLVVALERAGRRVDALRAFQRARAELAEIGLSPTANLRALEAAIVVDDPALPEAIAAMLDAAEAMPRPARVSQPLQDGRSADASQRYAIPHPSSTWVGDRALLRTWTDLVRANQLVTLVGPGGVGKTRAAIEIARVIAAERVGQGLFFDLSTFVDGHAAIVGMSSAVGVPGGDDTGRARLVDWFGGRDVLVVLDNCEHVRRELGRLVVDVLAGGRGVTILATSRAPLGIDVECVVPVEPLDENAAVEVFCRRAAAADARLVVRDDDLSTIAGICARLGNLPLAVELVAARMRTWGLDDLVRSLDTDEIHGWEPHANRPSRHRSLGASIDWGHRLLGEREVVAFRRLGVFAASFDPEAAHAVVGIDGPSHGIRSELEGLADASMLSIVRDGAGTRFAMLEPVRRFARERLAAAGEADSAHAAHLRFVVTTVDRERARWLGAHQIDAGRVLDTSWDDVRAAHRWALETRDLDAAVRIVDAVAPHAQARMRTEVGEWARATIESAGSDPLPPQLYGHRALWLTLAGDHVAAVDAAATGIGLAATGTHPSTTLPRAFQLIASAALGDLGTVSTGIQALPLAAERSDDLFARCWAWAALSLVGPFAAASSVSGWLERHADDAARSGSPFALLGSWYFQSMWELFGPALDVGRARDLAARGLELAQETGDRQQAQQFTVLGFIVSLIGGHAPDPIDLQLGLEDVHDSRNWMLTWLCLECIATTLVLRGATTIADCIDTYLLEHGHAWGGNPAWSALRSEVRASAGAPEPVAGVGRELVGSPAELIEYVLDHLRRMG